MRQQMDRTLNVVIAGASGRMGRTLIEAVARAPHLRLHAALDRADSPSIGRDAGDGAGLHTGVLIGSDVARALDGAHALVDFTLPVATLAHLDACRAGGVSMVIGTTGFDVAGRGRLAEAARAIPLVFAPNMSVGVNVAFKLVETAARILGEAYDVEVFEIHHRHKIDAPSGTAMRLGEVAAAALGHHTVFFAGAGERLEITHRSSSRANYALGALRAVRWLDGRVPGLYDMQDVLGLRGH
jgi:4-hydroxy-tetrahydrodipicolinate reductase